MSLSRLWLVAVVGCSAPAAAVDAPPASPDSAPSPIDAPRRPVTVRMPGRGDAPIADLPVLFHAPNGSLAARATTDAAGIASALVEDDGSVTVVEPVARQLTTIVGAAAGDELSIGELSWKEPSRQLSISVPPGPGGSNRYYLWGNHLQAGYSTSPLATTANALVPLSAPIIATAYEVTPGDIWTMKGYLYDPEVALEAGGTPALDGPWLPPVPFQLALTGVPPTVSQGAFETWRYAGGGPAYLFWSNFAVTAGAFTAQFPQAGGGDGTATRLWLYNQTPTSSGEYVINEYHPGQLNSLSTSVAADLISQAHDVHWTTGNIAPGVPGVTGLTWMMSGAGDHDGLVLRVEVEDPTPESWSWIVVFPPSASLASSYLFPTLPTDLVDTWGNKTAFRATVLAADTPATSYTEFRQDAGYEWPLHWLRAPTGPRKVRVSIGY